LSLLWQSLVVQTHLHAFPPPAATTAQAGSAAPATANPSRPDDPANCPICREAARAGHYLAPLAIPLLLRSSMPVAPSLATLPIWPRRHTAHGWYGRGPPSVSTHADP